MQKKKIGLLGFGKTGKFVAQEILKDIDFELTWVIRKTFVQEFTYASQLLNMDSEQGPIYGNEKINSLFFKNNPVDVIIDFSAASAVKFYAWIAKQSIPIVSAISHYNSDELKILEKCSKRTAVLYSPNITLGINILMIVSQILKKIVPHADIEILEEHFKGKENISGTAKKMAEMLSLSPNTVHAIRLGKTIGKHMIIFGLPSQTIRLSHESTSPAAFGQGAIFAARYIVDKKAGMYNMEQIVSKMFKENIPVY